ncbi:efflux transporter outer membrane subunit [Pararobbsia alpina]|uniref:efflux transporter outer membrane subunit n=1 Tax=Pararobbsia alpina TaxID=621374 RepID=UPI0039A70308
MIMSYLQMKRWTGASMLLAALLAVAGCSLTPKYETPDLGLPTAFKETPTQGPGSPEDTGTWKTATPSEALSRGEWWTVFGDPALNDLETQAVAANQNVAAAAARLKEARGLQQAARSGFFPKLDAGFGPTREQASAASLLEPDGTNVPEQTIWRAQASVSYEVDLFGRVAATANASKDEAQQSAALYRSVLLAVQADVAENYYKLRELDSEADIFTQTVSLREQALKLVQHRYDDGDISELDLAQAKSELASAKADQVGVARLRAASEHSLAVLLGKTPAQFSMAPSPLKTVDVTVPAGLPSSLLERRPDIAAAERSMAAANERIGIARAAYFPSLNLTGTGGFESATLGDLFKWSSRAFLLGPLAGTALTVPIFDGGARSGNLAKARATYEEQVANYRQQVLVAFQEVEDNLSNLRLLDDQIKQQDLAVSASERAEHLSQTQYTEGSVAYLDVIDSQRTVLQAQRASAQLAGAQMVSRVDLIRALGGGWQGSPATPDPAAAVPPVASGW